MSVLTPRGTGRSAWRRMTRPSRLVIVPSSSAHCATGNSTFAVAAVSFSNASHTTSRSSAASLRSMLRALGEATTTFDPKISSARMPPSGPIASSSS